MITKTYISKFNTIIKNSDINTGINPISELTYGNTIHRGLIYFDHTKIQNLVNTKIYPDISKLKHTLKITNSGSLDFSTLHCGEATDTLIGTKYRASSFTLIFFLIPQEWDGGKGFDYQLSTTIKSDYLSTHSDTTKLLSTEGSNWYNSRTNKEWNEYGVYSLETLKDELDKYENGEESVIIGMQNFDIGNENINLDITDVVNKFITNELPNYGIGIAFTPDLEEVSNIEVDEKYIAFFTHKTNTFFEPYVETEYLDHISDDRANFVLDKPNRLYLYANIGGELTNLYELPTCTVEGVEYAVKQQTKGVYYIDINLSSKEYKNNTMLYDIWGNIKYKNGDVKEISSDENISGSTSGETSGFTSGSTSGETSGETSGFTSGNTSGETIDELEEGVVYLDDIELEFVTKKPSLWFNIGNKLEDRSHLIPSAYGIKEGERIKRGDIRKVVIMARKEYTNKEAELIDNIDVRLYIKDGTREIDVLPYFSINKSFLENYFVINTDELIPQKYYLDAKVKYGLENIIHHNILSFTITDDLNNKYA